MFALAGWTEMHPAGTTTYASGRQIDLRLYSGRWEFTGAEAGAAVRSKDLGRSVAGYFSTGAQNPVRYVNA